MGFSLGILLLIYVLAVCRSIVGHFKHSSVAYHKLAAIQKNLHLTCKDVGAIPMYVASYLGTYSQDSQAAMHRHFRELILQNTFTVYCYCTAAYDAL